jgi:hypothetical protein
VLIAMPIFNGGLAGAAQTASADMAFRQAHWQDASHTRQETVTSLGAGWAASLKPNTGAAPCTKVGTYQLKADAANTYLRLGDPIGMDQFVAVGAGQSTC